MSINRPTDLPRWAEAPTDPSYVIEPPTSKQEAGWLFKDPPPFQLVNWMWRQLTRWAQHVADTGSRFIDPEVAFGASLPGQAAPMAPGLDYDEQFGYVEGGTCLIEGTLGNKRDGFSSALWSGIPGNNEIEATIGTGDNGPQAILVATGRSVIAVQKIAGPAVDEDPANQYRVVRLSRDLSTVVRTYYTGAPGEHIHAMISDGVEVCFAVNSAVKLYDHDTGALLWSATVPGTGQIVKGLAWDADRVWAVSANAGAELHKITRSTGGGTWNYNHGGALWSIAQYGTRLFVAGAASSHASGANFRCVEAVNGFDATNEGGRGVDTNHVCAFDLVLPTPVIQGRRSMVTDGCALWTAQGSTLNRRDLLSGVVTTSRDLNATLATGNIKQLDYDQDYIYAMTTAAPNIGGRAIGASVIALTPATLSTAWGWNAWPLGAMAIGSDCHALFVSSGSAFRRVYRGTTTQLWKRIWPGPRTGGALGPAPVVAPKRQVLIPCHWSRV
jgi:hypothetical protein